MSVTWRRTRTVAWTEIRRRWRDVRANPTQLLSLAVVTLFMLPAAIGLPIGAYIAGQVLQEGAFTTPVAIARKISVTLWVVGIVFGGFRGFTSLLDPDHRDGLLTTISHRQLLAGLLAAEVSIFGLPVAVVVVAAAGAFALGVGSVVAAPAMVVVVALLLASGYLTGLGVVLLFKNGGVRSRLLARLRTVVSVAVFVVYMGVILTNSLDDILEPLYWLLTPTPLGWVADLVVAAAEGGGSALLGGSAVVVGIAGIAVGLPVLSRLTAWLWYADGLDPVQSAGESTDASWLAGLLPQPTVGVVIVDWTRARRAPISLSYAVYPLLLLITPIIRTVETGAVSSGFPLLVAFAGAWITGSLFTLNVVGNEGSVLPSTLLAPAPGRALVGGHIAAGGLIGVPVTVAAVGVLGVLGPQPLWAVGTLTVGAVVLAAAAGPIATGIGAAFPRHEAVSVSRSRKAVVPSTLAFVGYSVLIGIVSLPALLGHSQLFGDFVASTLGVPPVAVALVGVGASLVMAAAFGLVSVLFALRRIDGYRIE